MIALLKWFVGLLVIYCVPLLVLTVVLFFKASAWLFLFFMLVWVPGVIILRQSDMWPFE